MVGGTSCNVRETVPNDVEYADPVLHPGHGTICDSKMGLISAGGMN